MAGHCSRVAVRVGGVGRRPQQPPSSVASSRMEAAEESRVGSEVTSLLPRPGGVERFGHRTLMAEAPAISTATVDTANMWRMALCLGAHA
jgi:hypothetical protein